MELANNLKYYREIIEKRRDLLKNKLPMNYESHGNQSHGGKMARVIQI